MTEHADVLILGGGVIGLTTAYYLSQEGVRVALIDKGDFGREASWAGAGIIPPGNARRAVAPLELLRSLSCEMYPDLSRRCANRPPSTTVITSAAVWNWRGPTTISRPKHGRPKASLTKS